jgi:hypothetical protein
MARSEHENRHLAGGAPPGNLDALRPGISQSNTTRSGGSARAIEASWPFAAMASGGSPRRPACARHRNLTIVSTIRTLTIVSCQATRSPQRARSGHIAPGGACQRGLCELRAAAGPQGAFCQRLSIRSCRLLAGAVRLWRDRGGRITETSKGATPAGLARSTAGLLARWRWPCSARPGLVAGVAGQTPAGRAAASTRLAGAGPSWARRSGGQQRSGRPRTPSPRACWTHTA